MRRLRDCNDPNATPWDEEELSEKQLRARAKHHSMDCDCRFCEERNEAADAEYERRRERNWEYPT